MARFDTDYLKELRGRYAEITKLSVQEQADQFKLRYVLSIGEDIMAIDDRVQMFLNDLPSGQVSFEYNDPKLNKYLEKLQVSFESFLVRNQLLNVFAVDPKANRMCFIQFLLHNHKEMILADYFKRWKLSDKSKSIVTRNNDHVAQAVLSELLDQPPYGVDAELDRLTKEEREAQVTHNNRVTQLETVVKTSEAKTVKSVKDKQAIQELAILRQTNIEDNLTYVRTQINKLARKVMAKQREAWTQVYQGTYVGGNTAEAAVANYTLPVPWEEYEDENSGAKYYHNPETGVTQWTRP